MVLSCFFKKREDDADVRVIFPRDILSRSYDAMGSIVPDYCDNTVRNSKYTLLTFVPLNLWEQLHRPINLYFLIVGLVQFISIVSPVSPLSMLVPLGIGFGITAAKEAYDDFLRHREDSRDNSREYRLVVGEVESGCTDYIQSVLPDGMGALKKHLKAVKSKDIRVGDIVVLRDGEEVPCDMIALLSCQTRGGTDSAEELFGCAFVSTENLDGEADAKTKHCVLGTVFEPPEGSLQANETGGNTEFFVAGSSFTHESGSSVFLKFATMVVEYLSGFRSDSVMRTAMIKCETPNRDVNRFHGSFTYLGPQRAEQAIVLDETNLLVGGSMVRSTAAVFGIAVYTGRETKANLSKKRVTVKWSQFDRLTTVFCVAVFIVQFALVIACGVVAYVWTEPRKRTLWYLGYHFQLQPNGSSGIPRSMSTDIINTWEYYVIVLPVRMFIMLTVLLPVSFKVLLEVSKYYISRCVEWDLGMCHEQARGGWITPAAKNSSLAEDLGQIDYVLTDKTGTLTRNEMQLRHLELFQPSRCHAENPRVVFSLLKREGLQAGLIEHGLPHLSQIATATSCKDTSTTVESLQTAARRALEILTLCNLVQRPPPGRPDEKYQSMHGEDSEGTDTTHYPCWESPSPDESALVFGAHLCGATLVDRNRTSALVRYASNGGGEKHFVPSPTQPIVAETVTNETVTNETAYQLIGVVPFSSERGRMSVIVRETSTAISGTALNTDHTSSQCYVLTKGADERVLPLCEASSVPHCIHTSLREYSVQGLRTLVLAWRSISPEEADAWVEKQKMAQAKTSVDERQRALNLCNCELERGLHVIGLTAVEDRLQDGVPETISLLREANVKVWMLTGDKIETAKQIGLSCKMLKPSDHLLDLTYESQRTDSEEAARARVAAKVDELRIAVARLGLSTETLSSPINIQKNNFAVQNDDVPEVSHTQVARDPQIQKSHRLAARIARLRDFFSFSANSLAVLNELGNPSKVVRAYVKGRGLHLREMGLRVSQIRSPSPDCGGQEANVLDFRSSSSNTLAPATSSSREHEGSHECSTLESEPRLGALDEPPRLSLLINGGALSVLQRDSALMASLKPLLLSAVTVICCRVAPDQKAFVVRLAKEEGHVTLAIGDGGNDVAMLQEAHVGVGITGFEGRQAALAADFTLAQFRFLARLMLVHGHQAYQRSSAIVQYSFYKCTFIAIAQVLYNCFTLMSGVTFWSSFALTVYNSTVTIPMTFCFAMGTPALPRKDLLTAPYLYAMSQKGRYMNGMTFLFTALKGFLQTCAIFFLGKYLLLESNIVIEEGQVLDAGVAYVPFYLAVLVVQVLTIICQTHGMTWVHWVCVSPLFGVGSFVVSWMVYTAMDKSVVGEKVSTFYFIISHANMWMSSMVVAFSTFFLLYAIHTSFTSRYLPTMLQLYRQVSVREAALQRAQSSKRIGQVKSDAESKCAPWLYGGDIKHDGTTEALISDGVSNSEQKDILPLLLELESECEDSSQGNDLRSLLKSLVPRI